MSGEWYPCDLCGSEYRGIRAALRCCEDRLEDPREEAVEIEAPDAAVSGVGNTYMTDGGPS